MLFVFDVPGHTAFNHLLQFQYLPSSDVHVNKNAKFDPSSKIFEVTNRAKYSHVYPDLDLVHKYTGIVKNWVFKQT